jgi:hypothetical protein
MSNFASNITKALNKKNNLSAAPSLLSPPLTSKNVPLSTPQNSSLISLFNKGPMNTLNSLSKKLTNNTGTTANSKNGIFGAMNTATNGVKNAAQALTNGVQTAATNVSQAATNVAQVASNAAKNAATTTSNVLNSVSKNTTNFMNNSSNYINSNVITNNSSSSSWTLIAGIFFLCFLIFLSIFIFFNKELQRGVDNLVERIRSATGLHKYDSEPAKEEPAVAKPEPTAPATQESILQKILPSEVFNVSKNEYTYYDAEALCSALGAELATYDQVKEAYEKGADWCNYGWVKGQGAVYPTQKSTWETLQQGPEEERNACGNPGLNGGHFDNPEMKFGVNCYGPKPSQSAHDSSELMKNGSIPKTVAGLQVYEKVNDYKKQIGEMEILPFNEGSWSSS